MEENRNNKTPEKPDLSSSLALWSVFLGAFGLMTDCFCFPLFHIINLPAGLFFGLGGMACAVLSRQGKPFSHLAWLGFALSLVSVVLAVAITYLIIFIYDIMDTDTAWGEYFRQYFKQIFEPGSQSLSPSLPVLPTK